MCIFRYLVEEKTLKILELLFKNKQKYFHLSEISYQSKISLASTFRIIQNLVSIGILDVILVGKMKIYVKVDYVPVNADVGVMGIFYVYKNSFGHLVGNVQAVVVFSADFYIVDMPGDRYCVLHFLNSFKLV